MSRDKGEARAVTYITMRLRILSTRLRHQTLASLQGLPVDRRYNSMYMKPMRQEDGLQTLFVDTAMQVAVDS